MRIYPSSNDRPSQSSPSIIYTPHWSWFQIKQMVFSLCITIAATFFFPIHDGLGADPQSPDSPPPFHPDEIQHGFSEFDTMPTIPPDSSPESSSDSLPDSSKDLEQPPEGLFHRIEFAEGFEEEEGLRRGHIMVPVHPTDVFQPDTRAVFIVFSVFKHYAPYQVFGRMYPEEVDGLDQDQILDEDTIFLATEDESGYLQFFAPSGKWSPGTYRVEIYVGYEINAVNRMGTMRFTVTPNSDPTSLP